MDPQSAPAYYYPIHKRSHLSGQSSTAERAQHFLQLDRRNPRARPEVRPTSRPAWQGWPPTLRAGSAFQREKKLSDSVTKPKADLAAYHPLERVSRRRAALAGAARPSVGGLDLQHVALVLPPGPRDTSAVARRTVPMSPTRTASASTYS
ncbi:hypothetical protein ON010_g401 [Phytophthora cinnamomi]|nr:hypothetical protein ON010_g401 [Phytophthora cinnamomi]